MNSLAFRHPLAGNQLVKGTIEQGDLGTWEMGYQDQIWSFHLCSVDAVLPDDWDQFTPDVRGAITFVREALQHRGAVMC